MMGPVDEGGVIGRVLLGGLIAVACIGDRLSLVGDRDDRDLVVQ
ncbi:hypothetical protein [Streptomyces sp. IBSBF 3136]